MNLFWSPFPTKRITKTPQKIRGKFGAKFGAKRKFEKSQELSFCDFSDLIFLQSPQRLQFREQKFSPSFSDRVSKCEGSRENWGPVPWCSQILGATSIENTTESDPCGQPHCILLCLLWPREGGGCGGGGGPISWCSCQKKTTRLASEKGT